jgi:hypothetical protein
VGVSRFALIGENDQSLALAGFSGRKRSEKRANAGVWSSICVDAAIQIKGVNAQWHLVERSPDKYGLQRRQKTQLAASQNFVIPACAGTTTLFCLTGCHDGQWNP